MTDTEEYIIHLQNERDALKAANAELVETIMPLLSFLDPQNQTQDAAVKKAIEAINKHVASEGKQMSEYITELAKNLLSYSSTIFNKQKSEVVTTEIALRKITPEQTISLLAHKLGKQDKILALVEVEPLALLGAKPDKLVLMSDTGVSFIKDTHIVYNKRK
jgi:hypothetical protein